MNTLLIGPRASGKTTIGRLLAQRLNQPFVDLDDMILAHFSQGSVRKIWAKHGETAWRQAEVQLLAHALKADGQIIALGGGTPAIPAAADLIKAAQADGKSFVVYLKCSAAELARRLIENPGDRPALTASSPPDEITEIVAQRQATYQALADQQCNTTGLSVDQTVEAIARMTLRHI